MDSGRTERVTVPGLPASLENYRILHISDLHGLYFGAGQERLALALKNARYNAVCVTGDITGPDGDIGAGRDLEGVRKCLLHAVWRTQGFGCAPGVLGVCIGADRAEGYLTAKRQLLRPLTDHAADPALAELERRVVEEANSLGIGPMGMGGKTTLLGVKIAGRTRLPASFFVTVAYLCWACRRRGIRVAPDGSRLLGEIDPMGEEQP